MNRPVFTSNRFTPMTISLLGVSVVSAAITVANQFFEQSIPCAHATALAGPLASAALAFVLMRKIDWNRR